MKNILISLVFLSLQAIAQDPRTEHPSERFFRVLPIEQSHTFFGDAKYVSLNPRSVKALVWNIKKAEVVGWGEEFSTFTADKDLVLIQEAYESDIFMKEMNTFRGIQCDFGISFLYMSYGATPTGNMICSQAKPTEFIVKHSPDREPITNTPKAMAIARYNLGNRSDLLVISIHGINFNSNAAFRRHLEQAKSEIENHDGPVLFAGDFNSHTNGRVSYLMSLSKKLGLIETKLKDGEFRSKAPVTGNYFDHVFTRGLTIKDARVIKTSKASDHRPMEIEFSL